MYYIIICSSEIQKLRSWSLIYVHICQIIRLSKTIEINCFLLVYIYNHYLIVIVSWGIVATIKYTCQMPINLLYRGQIAYKRHCHKISNYKDLMEFYQGTRMGFHFQDFPFQFFHAFKKNPYCFFQYMPWNLKVVLKTNEKRNIGPWTLMSKKY